MQLNLRIAIWNANGLPNHTLEVDNFLKVNYVDIFLVSETHFTSRTHFHIRGYDLVKTNHPDNRAHGGSCILVRSSIKYEILEEIQENYVQATCIKIKSNYGDVIVSSLYFPPRYHVVNEQYNDFFNKLGNKFIAGGDFNAKHPWWGSRLINPKGRELYKCLKNKNLSVLSSGSPTYWPSDPSKVPDLLDFVIYQGISRNKLGKISMDDLSSDHTPLLLNVSTSVTEVVTNNRLLRTETDLDTFKTLIDANLNLNVSLKTKNEIDGAVEHLTKTIQDAASLATPPTSNTRRNN